MNHYLDIIMFPIQLIVAFFTIYYTVIAAVSYTHLTLPTICSV